MESSKLRTQANPKDWSWRFWPILPLYPYGKRRTVCTEVVKSTIWTFDQIQGILYTIVPIRMTVIKLKTDGLLIYAPIAPTPECLRLLNTLVQQHGDIQYIILPTSSGLEHKVFVGPFARHFPSAQIFVAPSQWSFPINLPLNWLGFPRKRTQILPKDSQQAPFASEFDHAILEIDLGRGSFTEVAMFHKPTQTLLVTDTVISIPEEPPAVTQLDPYPLLFHARDSASEPMKDNPSNRRKGWQRIALFAVYFRPSALETVNFKQAVRESFSSPHRSLQAYLGFYPFRWQENWHESFKALKGRLFVAPILQTLILPQDPQQVINWANQVASWNFRQIIPCHFDAPIVATPHQFRKAFAFLEKGNANLLPEEDCKFIQELEANLLKWGIATPPKEKV